jgi:hypothetical protein
LLRFYWDNLVSRRFSPNTFTREQAIEKATGREWTNWPPNEAPRGTLGEASAAKKTASVALTGLLEKTSSLLDAFLARSRREPVRAEL